jgi:hypothetical protein
MSGDVAGSLVEKLKSEGRQSGRGAPDDGFILQPRRELQTFHRLPRKEIGKRRISSRSECLFDVGEADSGKQIVDESIIRP